MGSKRPTDIVKSFVLSSLPLKAENQPERFDGWSSAVEAWLAGSGSSSSSGVTAASDFLKALTAARGQLLGLLQVTSSSAAEVTAAQTQYLGLLVELRSVEQQTQQADGDAVLRSTWVDCILPLTAFGPDGTTSSSSSSKWFNTSARKKQAAAAATAAATAAVSAPAATSGVAYEAANTLLAVATWKMAKAGTLIMTQGGADSTVAMEGYQLYCQAAGVVDELRRKLLPQLGVWVGGDLSRELLTALHLYALGEAQNVMLQRAVALNYQGSTLAPMATDTAMLFSQAYEAIEAAAKTLQLPWTFLPPLESNSPTSGSSSSTADGSSTTPAKNSRMAGFERVMSGQLPTEWPHEAVPLLQLAAYVQYQVGHCYSLASICAAETALSSNQAGQAVALAQLGTNLCEQLADLGFEQSGLIDPVSTLGARDSSRRLALQATLEQKAAYVLRRCVRENRSIYFQYVPDSPSALPWPQRSAQPEIYRLPTPQGSLSTNTVKGLMTAAAVGSLSSFQAPTAAAAAQSQPPPPAAAAAAAAVIEPPVVDSRASGSSKVISPRLIDNTEPNSLANLADETAAAVAAATAAAATAGYMSATAAVEAAADDSSVDLEAEGLSEAAHETAAAAAAAEMSLSLQLDSSSYSAAAKSKADVSVDGGSASPVSSYTLTAGKDIGSTTSTDGSSSTRSSNDGGSSSSIASRRDSSSSGSSAVSSNSSSWSGADCADGTDRGSGTGFGGLLKGFFGCCLTPSGASMSEDGDESSNDQESEEEYEDSWETGSDVSKTSKQMWASKQQQWAN